MYIQGCISLDWYVHVQYIQDLIPSFDFLLSFPVPTISSYINTKLIMPTYRSITISLVSQFDLMVIPEYPPPEPRQDSVSTLPTLINEELSLISVFIPTYSGSQFWISYSIAPPNPPKALYYFKLFLNGACVVSWGCGKKDEYKGKTMFGLYGSEANGEGETGIQKRILCFREGYEGSDDDILEIKVYRCKGRRPCSPVLESYRGNNVEDGSTVEKEIEGNMRSVTSCSFKMKGSNSGTISLVNVGTLDGEHPQNFYQYALIDPLDTPFARFRYYYRPWGQNPFHLHLRSDKAGLTHHSPASKTWCRLSIVKLFLLPLLPRRRGDPT